MTRAGGDAVAGVSADLDNCFADDPSGVEETVALAVEAGLAGMGAFPLVVVAP